MIATMRIDNKRPVIRGCALLIAATMLSPGAAFGQQAQQGKTGKDKSRQATEKAKVDTQTKTAEKTKADATKAPSTPKSELKIVPIPGGQVPTGQITTIQIPAGQIPASQNPLGGATSQAVPGQSRVAEPGTPGIPFSQSFQFGGGRRGGGLGSGSTVSMEFRGSDINSVLRFFAMTTGWQIVPDASLAGNVTIISPKQLTIDQAFEVLQSTLQIRGFTGQFEKKGETTILKIVPLKGAIGPVANNPDGTPMSPDQLKSQVITQVIPIENVDARALATELTPLISTGASLVGSSGTNALVVTDIASNVKRIASLIEMLDKAASNSETKMFALQHSDATDVTNVVNNLFRQVFNRGRGGGNNPQGQPGMPNMGGGGAMQIGPDGRPMQQQGGDRAAVVAVADTRTNSVFVVASKENMGRVADLIAKLDDPDAIALKTKFRKIQYSDAITIADTVNGVLSGQNPRGGQGGQQSFAQRMGFGGGGFGGGGFGGFGGGGFGQQQQGSVQSSDPFAKVVAEPRTNSVIVTATEEKMTKIDDLIDQLDVNVPTESTVFVIPLKNGQAADIAYVLSQAFGTGQQSMGGFGGFGGGFSLFGGQQSTNQRRQPTSRRQGQSGSSGGFGRSVPLSYNGQDGAQSSDSVPGVMTPNGFVPNENSEVTRQFNFGGGGFGRQQMQTPPFGRGQRGNQVNLLQLRQNVGVIPDASSNSLIIQTNPENMAAIRQIIDQLDIVPRQVMIEVIIAEATLDATQKLGFQFDVNGIGRVFGSDITQSGNGNFPLGSGASTSANIAAPINPGGQYGIQAMSGRFRALIQSLQQDNRVRILSTPKVFASNNQLANIEITTRIPYVNSSQNGGFTGGQSLSYDFLDVGVILDVTPRITADKLVSIDVLAQSSEFLGFDVLSTTVDANGRVTTQPAPRTSQRATETTVTVRDGEAVVLGGLMRESKTINVNKVPLLGDIPILGHLFRSTNSNTIKTELMIFLIPHVVEGDKANREMVQTQSSNIRKAFPNLERDNLGLRGNEAEPKPEDPKRPDQTQPSQAPGQRTAPSTPVDKVP